LFYEKFKDWKKNIDPANLAFKLFGIFGYVNPAASSSQKLQPETQGKLLDLNSSPEVKPMGCL